MDVIVCLDGWMIFDEVVVVYGIIVEYVVEVGILESFVFLMFMELWLEVRCTWW